MTPSANITLVLLLAAVGAALFILPHHRRNMPDSTLRGTLAGLLSSEPSPRPAAMLMKFLIALGCLSVLAPPPWRCLRSLPRPVPTASS
jgi:hypothetical protein